MAELIRIDTDYSNEKEANALLKYIKNKAIICGGQNLQAYLAPQQMKIIRDYYFQNKGVLIYHFILTLDINNEYLPLEKMNELAYLICETFDNLQVFFGIHTGDNGYHIHFAVNPVSIIDGRKFCLTNSNISEVIKRIKVLWKLYSINKLGYTNKPVVHGFQFAEELDNILKYYNMSE